MKSPFHRVHQVRVLDEKAFVLRCERRGLAFEPGQYVNVGLRGSAAVREYSIYSGAGDDFLEVLVREIDGGLVSPALRGCAPGDELVVEGPHGMFLTDPSERESARYLFVGTGTGISPFHCFVRSFPRLDYLVLHGTRTAGERLDEGAFDAKRLVRCVSRGTGGDFTGRVTAWLREHPVDADRRCYLCGNSDMIYEAFSILRAQGVPRERVFAEIYF